MITIYKYKFQCPDFSPALCDMKAGANIIHVEHEHTNADDASRVDSFTTWAEVDTDQDDTANMFAIHATGDPFGIEEWEEHVVTWLDGPFVWHLYRTEAVNS
jgi:hypothetical protein